jgi:hypothetical protein
MLRIKNQLRDAIPITKINEDHTTKIADALYPARQCDVLSCLCDSQLTTSVCSIHTGSKTFRILRDD